MLGLTATRTDSIDLPGGTFTFFLTDIEGSTRLWEEHRDAMRVAVERHRELLASTIHAHAGQVMRDRGEGDSFFAIFLHARDAVAAASAIQQALWAAAFVEGIDLRIRIAVHTGDAEAGYWDPIINRCARVRMIAHGGQTLLSAATEALVRDSLPDGVSLLDLGQHRLRDLARPERIFQVLHPGLSRAFPPLNSLDAYRHNLPIQLTSFIGRELEAAELERLLTEARLLTLTGTGGCGKTRLALQVAGDLLEAYPQGVWLVELASLADPGLVTQAVATILRLREQPGLPLLETLIDELRGKRVLLVLDNCEHLVEPVARLVEVLLQSCPGLRVLVTSREALRVPGEVSWRVPSLTLPGPNHQSTVEELARYEAVHLFLDRAVVSRPTFTLTDQNALAVTHICARLDGIPLGIELAAARVGLMPVVEILDRLEDRFRLLTGGSRTAMPHQQTLRAAVEWSYNLLSPDEQRLFERLSVFAGGFQLQAAEEVCTSEGVERAGIVELMSRLVDKSLVVAGDEREGAVRYRLLQTLRQYAEKRLVERGDIEMVRLRHADFFIAMVRDVEPKLRGPEQGKWLQRLEEEHDNLRAALRWCVDAGDSDRELSLAGALVRFWLMHGYLSEGRQWVAGALARSAGSSALRATALLGEARLAWGQGDDTAADSQSEKSLAMWRELGDTTGVAHSLNSLGAVAHVQGDHRKAQSFFEESLVVARETGDQIGIARALNNLGTLAFELEEYDRARSLHEESLALRRQLNDRWGTAMSLGNLGDALFELEQRDAARSHYEESLALRRELADPIGIAFSLERFALLASAHEQPERALRLAGAAAALRKSVGSPLYPNEQVRLERRLAQARRELGPAAEAAWTAGTELSTDEAVDEALSA